MIKILNENQFFEMANVSKKDTGLPYNIWIDSAGASRNTKHNIPRIKVDTGNDLIPVSISRSPEILVNKKIPKFLEIQNYIIKYYDVLMSHWNKEITDKQALNLLGK